MYIHSEVFVSSQVQSRSSAREPREVLMLHSPTHQEVYVRTNIVLDDQLVREAMKLAGVKTKREAVDFALRRFVQSGRQRRMLALKGTGGIKAGYDHKRARSGG